MGTHEYANIKNVYISIYWKLNMSFLKTLMTATAKITEILSAILQQTTVELKGL